MIACSNRRLSSCLLVVGMASTVALPARAQIVNVQPQVVAPDQQGFATVAEGTVDWRTGNNDLLILSGTLTARYQTKPHLLFLLTKAEYGQKNQSGNKTTLLDRDFEHLRYRWIAWKWLQPEGFVQHDRDAFRRLALRALAGVGPRFVLLSTPAWELALGVAYMVELEKLGAAGQPDDGKRELAHRLSSYLVAGYKLGDALTFGLTAYAQPKLNDFHDLRVLTETSLVFAVSEHLAFKVALTGAYDSRPPQGLKPLDTAIKNSLQVHF